MNIITSTRKSHGKRLHVGTILKSWGVSFNPGHGFWAHNAGALETILFDARKVWKKLRKASTDHASSVEINRKWEFIKDKFKYKTAMKTLVILLLSTLITIPATFDIGWEARPLSEGVTGYLVYLGQIVIPVAPGGVQPYLLAVGQTNRARISLPEGAHRLTVTSTNAVEESLPSLPLYVVVVGTNVVAVTARPGAPINLQLR